MVFIDESGDPGFQVQKGSSAVFVIALVIFDDHLEAEAASLAVKRLRRELKFPETLEFKFHKSQRMVKKIFLETAAKHNFRIRAIVVNKDRVYSNYLRTSKASFYNYIVMQVIKHSGKHVSRAKLKFDKRGEKRIRNELRTYLSRELDNKANQVFSDLKFVDSRQNSLIQMADMIAGCIARHHRVGDQELYGLIKKRIEDIWEFK